MRQINMPLPNFPTLETAALRLRETVPADAEAIFRVFADEEVTRYYDMGAFSTLDQVQALIGRQAARFQRGEMVRWSITQKANGVHLGSVGVVIYETNAQGGLGYELARPYWRKGIMTEALTMVIRFSFRTLNLNRLQALVMPGNEASAGLLRKLGFVEEGLLREYAFFKGRYRDLYCFSLLRREWEERQVKRLKDEG